MKKWGLVLFVVVSIGELLAIVTRNEFLHLTCKPLIMVSLAVYYWTSVYSKDRSNAVMLAICFSFLGDTLLLLGDEEIFFILGLVSFLLAHLFYVLAYRQHRYEDSTDALHGVQRVRLAFPIVLGGTGLLVVLYPELGSLRIPVIVYTAVILIMVLSALFRWGRTSTSSFWLVFGGALLFMISDSVLAINKFYTEIQYAGLYIMIPYILAQYAIVRGLIRHTSKD